MPRRVDSPDLTVSSLVLTDYFAVLGLMAPSFLIVVPTLDSYLILPRLVSSLQAQSWSLWRVLFVDGPSSPEHRQWLEACCEAEPRCSWVEQNPAQPGIFGAMSQGFLSARPSEWLFFWGSDDWAAAPTVFSEVAATLEDSFSNYITPDLLVCRGRYVGEVCGSLLRGTAFRRAGVIDASVYRHALLFGSTPPHQATLFGLGARQRLNTYAHGFRLSADLDYFLQLSGYPDLCVQCSDIELVHMSDGGVSGQQTSRRLKEVRHAYFRAFGWYWFIPFLMRYLKRLISLFNRTY